MEGSGTLRPLQITSISSFYLFSPISLSFIQFLQLRVDGQVYSRLHVNAETLNSCVLRKERPVYLVTRTKTELLVNKPKPNH